jgi:hypothetical protein
MKASYLISYGLNPKKLLKRHEIDKLTWRQISDEIGINPSYVFNYAVHGIEPTNPEIRAKLGLKKICKTCKRQIKDMPKTYRHLDDLKPSEVLYLLNHREIMNEK